MTQVLAADFVFVQLLQAAGVHGQIITSFQPRPFLMAVLRSALHCIIKMSNLTVSTEYSDQSSYHLCSGRPEGQLRLFCMPTFSFSKQVLGQ
jgi:hypothetical protein